MSDPVTTAMIQELVDKLKAIGAPIPIKYECEHTINGKSYKITLKVKEKSND